MAIAEDARRRVEFPADGYTLFVNDEKHAYFPANDKGNPGIRCPGASSVSKAFPDSPNGLMYWTETKTLDGVARLSAGGNEIPHDPYALKKTLERHGLRWEQLRDAAGKRGRDIHELVFEALGRGDEVPDLDVLEPDDQGYGQAVFSWWQDRNPEPILVEHEVMSREHRFAGRFDLYCTIQAHLTDRFNGVGIVDAKSGKGIYRADHIQQRLYELAMKECGLGTCDWLMLLHLHPDGTYTEHYVAATPEDALLAIQAYDAAKKLDRNMKAA